MAITARQSQFDLTVLDARAGPGDIQTSLLVPLATTPGAGRTGQASVALILYAATPGAFVDLAAELSWITGRALAEFRLDGHLSLPSSHTEPTTLRTMSAINQALGVLIGRGSSPVQAERDLYARAASAGIEPLGVAALILAALGPPEPTPA